MTKPNKGKKAESGLGKGHVTPIQIAFIVDRYLADNNYTKTLAVFRTEAHDLLSKTKCKEAPKGLLGLGELLDDYIRLKEQKLMVDQNKWRVEMALQGMQEVVRAYQSPAGGVALPQPQSPPLLPPQFFPRPNPSNVSPPSGNTMNGAFVTNYLQLQPPIPPLKTAAEPNKFSTPVSKFSPSSKRKASKYAPRAPKKSRTRTQMDSSKIEGKTSPSQLIEPTGNENHMAVPSSSVNDPKTKSPNHGSSVAKILFKEQLGSCTTNTSPETPQKMFPSQSEKLVSSEDPPLNSNGVITANHSIVSSETFTVSPLKRAGYYAIERSVHVTSSPFKLSPKKMGKRDQVKGKLQFDEPGVSEIPVSTNGSTPSTDEETTGDFNFDFSDLDIFSGDFSFSEFLGDIDLDCGELTTTCQLADFADGYKSMEEHNRDNGCSETSQGLSGDSLSTVTRVLSATEMTIQGSASTTSMRAITKRVEISSPAKPGSKYFFEHDSSPSKL